MPKIGDKLPLSLQLFDGAEDKFVIAILKNAANNPLPESPVSLTHIGNGKYEDNSVSMPATSYVSSTYEVYNDIAHTIPSEDHSSGTSIFELTILDQDLIDMLVALNDKLGEILEQRVILPAPADISVKILDDKIKIKIIDDEIKKNLIEQEVRINIEDEEKIANTIENDVISVKETCGG